MRALALTPCVCSLLRSQFGGSLALCCVWSLPSGCWTMLCAVPAPQRPSEERTCPGRFSDQAFKRLFLLSLSAVIGPTWR